MTGDERKRLEAQREAAFNGAKALIWLRGKRAFTEEEEGRYARLVRKIAETDTALKQAKEE
jgi:hypothetical protein